MSKSKADAKKEKDIYGIYDSWFPSVFCFFYFSYPDGSVLQPDGLGRG